MTTQQKPGLPKLPLTGQCQCGVVKYTITSEPYFLNACHCLDCQYQSGSAFALSLSVPPKGVQVTTDNPALSNKTIPLPDPFVNTSSDSMSDMLPLRYFQRPTAYGGKLRSAVFCNGCGVRLWTYDPDDPNEMSFKAGTLDVGCKVDLRAAAWQLWTSRMIEGVVMPEGIESYSTEPHE